MTYLALALIAVAASAASAAPTAAADRDRGPGIAGQRQGAAMVYAVRDFDAIRLGGAERVIVHIGNGYSVRAEGPAAAFANFRIARDGSALFVGRRYDERESGAMERQIVVHVTMPALRAASVGGSGSLTADRAGGDRFAAAVGGSGSVRIDALDARSAQFNVGGSGTITAAGTVGDLEVNVGGSGDIAAAGLRATSAKVSVGGSGTVRAQVNGPARVSMAGSGSVDLGPQARCTVSKVGSGRVRCGG